MLAMETIARKRVHHESRNRHANEEVFGSFSLTPCDEAAAKLFSMACLTFSYAFILIYHSTLDAASSHQLDSNQLLKDADFLKKYSCDFGVGLEISLCSWSVDRTAHKTMRWKAGQGAFSHWSGGPPVDHTSANVSGGFAYFETSYKHPTARTIDFNLLSSWVRNVTTAHRLPTHQTLEQRLQPLVLRLQSLNSHLQSRLSLQNMQNMPSIYRLALKDLIVPTTAVLRSPLVTGTRPQGVCLTFYYAISGLSADRLSVTIVEPSSGRRRHLWVSRVESVDEWTRMEISYAHPSDHVILMEAVAKQVTDIEREYRGYVALDDIKFVPMGFDDSCYGHCTFDGGLCDWRNDEEEDDLDWRLAKGSASLFTGPAQDYNSFARDLSPGNFLFVDGGQLHGHAVRYADRALLISPDFPATAKSKGFCFKFAYHMFGDGIGNLSVLLKRQSTPDQQLLWKISGEQGNAWRLAQVPVYSGQPFNLLIEATIGPTSLANIAIDVIHILEEFCATSPSVASIRKGDCTFEDSLCDWNNKQHVDDFDWVRLPHPATTHAAAVAADVKPVATAVLAADVRRQQNQSTLAYYLTLNGDMLRPDKAGLAAQLQSPLFPAHVDQCMTFNYFMYQNTTKDAAKDPSLGGIRVYLQQTEAGDGQAGQDDGSSISTSDQMIWRLTNHQSNKWRRARVPIKTLDPVTRNMISPVKPYYVLFEGIWANGKDGAIGIDDVSFTSGECDVSPANAAAASIAECSFDKTLCGWTTYQTRSSHSKSTWLPWKLVVPATSVDASAFIKDHTFNIAVGYVSFTAPASGESVRGALLSPILSSRDDDLKSSTSCKCFSFWFRSFPGSDNLPSRKTLSVFQAVLLPKLELIDAKSLLLWQVSDNSVSDRTWTYGQVSVRHELSYRLLFKVQAHSGGFAVDDVTFYDGACQSESLLQAVDSVDFTLLLSRSSTLYRQSIGRGSRTQLL